MSSEPGANSPAPAIPLRTITITLVLAVLAYFAVAVMADWDGVQQAASEVSPIVLLQVVVLSLASFLLRFVRWHFFMKALGHTVPWRPHLEIYLSGLALTVSPGKLGEMVRSIYLRRYGVSYAHSIAAFIGERIWDLSVLAPLACLALLLFPAYWITAIIPLVACALLILAVRTPLALALVTRFAHLPAGQGAANAVAAMRTLFSLRQGAPALLVTAPVWVSQGLCLYLIVDSLGYSITAPAAVGIYCLGILAGAVSFIPAGLGATEAAMVIMLKASGVQLSDAIYAALIARALPLWLAVGVGVIAMMRAGRTVRQSV